MTSSIFSFIPSRQFRAALALLPAVLLCHCGFAAAQSSQKLIDLDFSANAPAMNAADPQNLAQGRTTGELPSGWTDDSSWARLNVDYKLLVEEGQQYVAAKVGNVEKGYAQMRFALPDYQDGSLFKLTLKARGTTGTLLEFGVRMAGNPYQYAHVEKLTPESTWKTYESYFTLDRNKQPMGFWVAMCATGEVDIAKLVLERVSREALVAEIKERNPGNGPANVLRNTRLPLGLQSGWTINRDSLKKAHNPEIFPDSKETGISGFPALHLKAVDPLVIHGEPFEVPVPIQKYTASLYIKGTGKGRVNVKIKRKGIASKEFTATGEWQRVEVPFEPRLGEKLYTMDLSLTGDVLVDGWQVNPGDQATPYRSQLPVEVSLACPAAETSEARVQFSNEPALVDYYVSGNPFVDETKGTPTLHAKIVNLYGEEALIKPIALKSGNVNTGKFNFDLFPKRPLGPMRIETWVEDAKGQRISTFQELIIYRLHRPRYWGKDAPDSPFGAHVEADTAHIEMAKAIGNNWVRLHDTGMEWIGWNFLEPEPGQWTFFDDQINRYRKQHLKILGELSTTPYWASYDPEATRRNGYWDKFFQPKDLAAYANYVKKVTDHYKGVIDTYEVWNEPWNAAWFAQSYDRSKTGRMGYKSGDHPQAEYAAIMKTAYEAAKAAYPGVKIIGINTTTTETNTKPYPDTGGADWTKGMKALNAENDCDILGYHQYDYTFNGFPGDAVKQGFDVAMGPFREAGVKKPIWFTEGSSVNRIQASGFYHYTLPYLDTENTMDTGNRNCRFALSLLANGCEKLFLYSMGSYGHFSAGTSEQWASLISEDGYLHPTAAAFSHMAWELEDIQFKKFLPAGAKSFIYLFQGKKKSVAVIAPAQEGDRITLPKRRDWTLTDQLGNPQPSGALSGNTLVYIETAQSLAEFEPELAKLAH